MWQEEDSLFSAPSSPQAQLVTRVATDQAQQDLRDTRLRFAEEELERLRREAEQNRHRAERAEALVREVAAGTPAQSSLHPSLVHALAEDGMFPAQLSAHIITPVQRLRGSELVGKLSIVTAITPSTPSFVAQHADVLHGRNARKSFQFHEPSQYLHALAVAHRHGVYSEHSSTPKRARVGDRGSASSSSAAAAAPSGVYEVVSRTNLVCFMTSVSVAVSNILLVALVARVCCLKCFGCNSALVMLGTSPRVGDRGSAAAAPPGVYEVVSRTNLVCFMTSVSVAVSNILLVALVARVCCLKCFGCNSALVMLGTSP